MTGRIVTTAHRYKRPTRKQQAAPLAGPAVVTRLAQETEAEPTGVTAPPPANDDRKPRSGPAMVTTPTRRKGWVDEGSPSDPEMRAWLEQAIRGRGPPG